jgi:hypothetical protein
VLKVNLK